MGCLRSDIPIHSNPFNANQVHLNQFESDQIKSIQMNNRWLVCKGWSTLVKSNPVFGLQFVLYRWDDNEQSVYIDLDWIWKVRLSLNDWYLKFVNISGKSYQDSHEYGCSSPGKVRLFLNIISSMELTTPWCITSIDLHQLFKFSLSSTLGNCWKLLRWATAGNC